MLSVFLSLSCLLITVSARGCNFLRLAQIAARDHSLTHFSQNEPAYFKRFKVRFHGSFRWSKYQLLSPPPPIPSSVFPSLFLCWHFAASHTGHCQQGRFWLYRGGYSKQLRESVSGWGTSIRRAVMNRGNAVLSVCAVSFRNFRRLAVCGVFSVLQFVLITPLYTNYVVCSCKKLSCHLPVELAIYWTGCNYQIDKDTYDA